ncbi:FkbM family methyltransferase [Phyllobacterium sp. OV277]|uniref:FkbM family methyltransferase n=1 Tax=Phyllobacterium sp. OV277 TaxID=1882772 RepID=UPI0008854809|nr:FkbM family methyltransferase [Phyllobacterium sp. OV277]SDO47303.1 methyltransferase, FkbM family [Phyllobacterium sp. OV277]
MEATAADIDYCFRLILGRLMNEVEKDHYTFVGLPLETVVRKYLNSLEFQGRRMLDPPAQTGLEKVFINNTWVFADRNDGDVGEHIVSGAYEPNVTRIFQECVKPGMRVVDIGANIGYFSMLSASLVGHTGRVLSVEPNVENGRLLAASRDANAFTQIEILLTAVSDRTDVLSLSGSSSNGTTATVFSGQSLEIKRLVPCVRLDDVLHEWDRVDFVKIDIEGAEYKALNGMIRTLRRFRPLIISEFNPSLIGWISSVKPEDYLGFLFSLGYKVSVITPEGNLLHRGTDIAAIMNDVNTFDGDHIDFLAQPI